MKDEGLKTESDKADADKNESFVMLALTAFATSIDAMAVGVGLAFVNVGIMVGRLLSSVIGGVILIGVGATILYEHLSA